MDDFLNLYVVEYSRRQDQFHIHRVSEMLKTNLGIFARGGELDYVPLGYARTTEEANTLTEAIRNRTAVGD